MAEFVNAIGFFVAFAAVIVLHFKAERWMSWPITKLKYGRWCPGSEDWPQAEGLVESATWDYEGKNEQTSWPVAKIAYSYKVDGERYASLWERPFWNADQATEFTLKMRDRKLLVRYHPGKPAKSVVSQLLGV